MSSQPACPLCTMNDLGHGRGIYVCATCGHEWPIETEEETSGTHSDELVVKDANGNLLVTGDSVVLIKDLKLKGSSTTIKGGTKIKNIKLVSGDHEIDCKADGMSLMLKACFVRKA